MAREGSDGRRKPESLAGKAFWILKKRPLAFARSLRGYLLFRLTGLLAPLAFGRHSGIRLGRGVRLQRLRSLGAERPGARIVVGDHSIVYENASLGAYGSAAIEIGENSVLGDIRIESRHGVTIGRRFISSWNVFIQDFDPHPVDPVARGRQVEEICAGFRPRFAPPEPSRREEVPWEFPGEAIRIGDDAWIGANCTLLKGARIGDGCIVATGSVVLGGDYPDRSLIAGNPAKVVKRI